MLVFDDTIQEKAWPNERKRIGAGFCPLHGSHGVNRWAGARTGWRVTEQLRLAARQGAKRFTVDGVVCTEQTQLVQGRECPRWIAGEWPAGTVRQICAATAWHQRVESAKTPGLSLAQGL